MAITIIALLIAVAEGAVSAAPGIQSARASVCAEWHDCRQMALSAAASGDYETFHDLAWRAVQTGPKNDATLMYLLARAQSLSGRAHDALVMLGRLADMGIATDAATSDAFSGTRQLPGWPDVEGRIQALIRQGATPLLSGDTSGTTTAGTPAIARVPSATAAAAGLHFAAEQLAVSGVAYDSVSRRFVVGDRLGRKLIVADERSHHTMDLVGAGSAGFLEIAALEIDPKRGDLWVASAASSGAGTLHKLQLVSGRPLRAFHVAADREPVKLVDIAVASGGTVFVLDALTPQLFVLRAGGAALEPVMRIDAQEPVSVAAGREDGILFVAQRDGVSRVDVRSRTAAPVAPPKGVSLRHLERIRWHGTGLVAVQVGDDGARRIMRLEMDGTESAITGATKLDVSIPAVGQTFAMTVTGDNLVYLIADPADANGRASRDVPLRQRDFVAYRFPLR